jgi:hypothetical protein
VGIRAKREPALYCTSSKSPANSHVKPRTPQNPHSKSNKHPRINHLQAKNKSRQTGALVSLNPVELKVDRKQKRPGQKPGLRL